MNVLYLNRISREDVRNNRSTLFIFGDNDLRAGYGGQAQAMRGEPNAFGIRVKKRPDNQSGSFYTDEEYSDNCKKISDDIRAIVKIASGRYNVVVISSSGVGTGLAQLKERAPKTLEFLNKMLSNHSIKNGVSQ